MSPADITVTGGRPDARELAAVLAVLLTRTGTDTAPARTRPVVRRRPHTTPLFPTPRSWQLGDPTSHATGGDRCTAR